MTHWMSGMAAWMCVKGQSFTVTLKVNADKTLDS